MSRSRGLARSSISLRPQTRAEPLLMSRFELQSLAHHARRDRGSCIESFERYSSRVRIVASSLMDSQTKKSRNHDPAPRFPEFQREVFAGSEIECAVHCRNEDREQEYDESDPSRDPAEFANGVKGHWCLPIVSFFDAAPGGCPATSCRI